MKNWIIKPKIPLEIVKNLSEFPEFLSQLLYNRGFTENESAKQFLEVKYENLYSPFLFLDMEKAVKRIWQAIENKEKICIYGDYDADAVTANAVLQHTFRYLGTDVSSYIPDRFAEGYGINLEALNKIREQGVTVIITVDCGTNSVDAGEFCKKNGIDLIITDHHEVIGELPEAFAIINPKNKKDNYPYQNIVGVGVAFKLACGILSSEKCKEKSEKYVVGWEKWLLDLVAIGTVADCHTLDGENRILVKYGLKVLQKTKWVGLKALMEVAKIDFTKRPADTYTLGFVIAPRLNAAGRLEHADTALNLLMENNYHEAVKQAVVLEEINSRRQDQTLRIVSEAKEQVFGLIDRKIIVMRSEGWSKGIVGLVAGRISEEFRRPTIILEQGEFESTGSARTVGSFDVVESLKFASEYLVRFGGHKQAAGLTLKNEHYEPFYKKILEYAEINLKSEDLEGKLVIDAELNETEISIGNYKLLEQLEPFGVGNIKPKFLINKMQILSSRPVGKNEEHTQFVFKKEKKEISAIAFKFNLVEKKLNLGDTVDIVFELILNSWNGREEVKLRIVDIRANNELSF